MDLDAIAHASATGVGGDAYAYVSNYEAVYQDASRFGREPQPGPDLLSVPPPPR